MRPQVLACLLASLSCILKGCVTIHNDRSFTVTDSMLEDVHNGIQGELEWSGIIDLGPGVRERARIEITNKGNGWLYICNKCFRVYDAHHDCELFDPSMLHITFIDVDMDGYRDLLLQGTRILFDENDKCESETGREPILLIYRYSAQSGQFQLMASGDRDQDIHSPE